MKNFLFIAAVAAALLASCKEDEVEESHNHLTNDERVELIKGGFFFDPVNVVSTEEHKDCVKVIYDDPDAFDFSRDACCVSDVAFDVDVQSFEDMTRTVEQCGECFFCVTCGLFHLRFDCYDYSD